MKAPEDPKNRQFLQLNRFRRERTAVHVYLLSGTRFTGRIRSFDVHTLLLETQHGEMVIYGHAVSTIEPATAQRGRRPAGPGGSTRRDEGGGPGGYRREGGGPPRGHGDARGYGDARGPGEQRGYGEPRPDEAARSMPDDDAADAGSSQAAESRPAPPAAPTVTIVRRRSRLIPPRD